MDFDWKYNAIYKNKNQLEIKSCLNLVCVNTTSHLRPGAK